MTLVFDRHLHRLRGVYISYASNHKITKRHFARDFVPRNDNDV